jgi:hypothetical protein
MQLFGEIALIVASIGVSLILAAAAIHAVVRAMLSKRTRAAVVTAPSTAASTTPAHSI